MSNDYTKITVLWVEDNPLISKGIVSNAPAIVFDGDEHEGLERFFDLRVLQHPEEIREYLALCRQVEDAEGIGALGSICGAVPEIVVFDYKLFGNLRINQVGEPHYPILYLEKTKPLREALNPSYSIVKHLNDKGSPAAVSEWFKRHYNEMDFVRAVYGNDIDKDVETAALEVYEDDEFGLFAGVEIVRRFREHACVGVPATANKEDRRSLHPISRYYEWLNEPEFTSALDRTSRGKKGWNSPLGDAVAILRNRIDDLARCGRVTLSYENLRAIRNSGSVLGTVLSLRSTFGLRRFALVALFIDKPAAEREKAASEWIDELIGTIAINDEEVEMALRASDELWNTFTSHFGDRLQISALEYRRDRGDDLSSEDLRRAQVLKDNFVDHTAGKLEKSLLTLLENAEERTVRLAALHLIATAAIAFAKIRKNAKFDRRFFYDDLDEDEVLNLLFPLAIWRKEDWLLPIHKKTDRDDQRRNLQGRMIRKLGVLAKGWWNPENWIERPERSLLRAIFFDDIDFHPAWFQVRD